MTTYIDFLRDKADFESATGFDVDANAIHPILKPHQRAIVKWAVAGGRRAIFASFGLGKTVIQLETLRLILGRHPDMRALIVCPLGVRQEFTRDAAMLGTTVRFVRWSADVDGPGIYLTNYESVRDGRLEPALFDAVSLDEASVLRSFGSKTYQTFLTLFDGCRYKYVATATPSPNRYKELIHYAGFLGVMDTGQALTRFFQRDSTQANNLTLYPHKEHEFWLWLNTWAVFLSKPSDLGYDDTGYDLPGLDVVYHEVDVDHSTTAAERDGQGRLFRGGNLGVSEASREKRSTMDSRVSKLREIVESSPEDHFILWHDLEDERRAIKAALPEAVEVYGTLDLDIREQRIIDFSDGRFRLLATKPELSGSGCNFQRHCAPSRSGAAAGPWNSTANTTATASPTYAPTTARPPCPPCSTRSHQPRPARDHPTQPRRHNTHGTSTGGCRMTPAEICRILGHIPAGGRCMRCGTATTTRRVRTTLGDAV